jgi:hypothetical protein
VARLLGSGPDARRVVDRAQREDSSERRTGDVEPARRRTGRDQQLAERPLLAVLETERPRADVEGRDRRLEPDLDVVLALERLVLDERVRGLGLAA